MKRVFYWIYHELQNHYWTLLFISKLQKMQITTMIGDIVCYPSIRKNMKSPGMFIKVSLHTGQVNLL